MSTQLLDDHLLLCVLLNDEPGPLRPEGATIATTGLWYHRLCRALADDTALIGTISRRLGAVDPRIATEVLAAVIDLAATIELISLRSLGWPMAQVLRQGPRLNLLSLEALAAATALNAVICLAEFDDNNPLRTAAAQLGIAVRTIAD